MSQTPFSFNEFVNGMNNIVPEADVQHLTAAHAMMCSTNQAGVHTVIVHSQYAGTPAQTVHQPGDQAMVERIQNANQAIITAHNNASGK